MSDAENGAVEGVPEPTPDFGASPEEIQQALDTYRGLNNLDTRSEYLSKIVRPDIDTHFIQQFNQPQQEEEPDYFESFAPEQELMGYDAQGQPVYGQPPVPQQGFDPRSLAPVFDQFGEHTRQQAVQEALAIFEKRQMEQAREQGISQGVSSAAAEHGLSDFAKGVVEQMTRATVQSQPNRAPADIAKDMAKAYLDDAAQRFVQNGGVPPVQGAPVPGGPIPGDSAPKSFKEAMEQSLTGLNPSV
jgi:hypothetical protein